MGGLQQLNLSYNPGEDRLLFRMIAGVDSECTEYSIWLTRRFVRLLWEALDRFLEQGLAADMSLPDGVEAVKQFQQEAALSKADFATPYRGENVMQKPLGEQPILVTKLQIKKQQSGQYTLSLQSDRGVGINLGITEMVVHSLRKIIIETVTKAQWDLPFVQTASGNATPIPSGPVN